MATKDKLITAEELKYVHDKLADNLIVISEVQPSSNDNKLWINDSAIGSVQVPTYAEFILLSYDVPNTVQTYTFVDGSISQIVHKQNTTTIRTDVFTYSAESITEMRTLNTGESLSIVTNLATLETTVTFTTAQ